MNNSEATLGIEMLPASEPERYEFSEPRPYHFDLPRRDFFRVLGAGIVVVSIFSDAAAQQRPQGGQASTDRGPREIGAWVHIGEDGTVTGYTGKVELGQNIRTSLSQALAEELRVTISAVHLVMADTELTPFDLGTFGSQTTPRMLPQVRLAAAAAREWLVDLAAEKWHVDRGSLEVADGGVRASSGSRSAKFGELAQGQQTTRTISDAEPVTASEKWRILGESVAKVGGRDYVTGRHKYASDVKRSRMLQGKVLRPPANGASLQSLGSSKAEAIPGVTVVHDGDFVGVAAPNEQIADEALAALQPVWKTTDQLSDAQLFDYLKTQSNESQRIHSSGSITDGLAGADIKLEQTYRIAYIAHAPLEPRAAVAEWDDDKLTVWTGSQRPFANRDDLAKTFRIPNDQVRVIVPDTGSGYGGKQSSEMVIEAARLARGARKPVKVVWTREEEFAWAYFRPAGVIEVRSGAYKDGKLTAWELHNYNSGGSGIRPLYEIPHQLIEFHPTKSPLRQGSYRALAATANHFARESHMDDLAHALRAEPLEFRLRNLKDDRMRAVLKAAAQKFEWESAKPAPNCGVGIAAGFEKNAYVATCAEIAVEFGEVRVVRAVAAFDCGAVVNPDHLKNQIEGSLMMGLGGALFEQIKFENGRITNGRFSRYRVPRFSDMPIIDVVLVDRKDLPPAGAGETSMVTMAPAIGNAIFQATGRRLTSLPMAPDGLKA